MSRLSATARGKLSVTPIWELLVFCLERKLTGTLVLESPQVGRSALSFLVGSVTKAKLAEPVHRFGEVGVELGLVTPEAIERVGGIQAQELTGRKLLSSGEITEDQQDLILTEQLVRQVEWCSKLPGETVFGYYSEQDLLKNWAGEALTVDPLQLIARSVWCSMAREKAAEIVANLGSDELRLHPDSRVLRFGLEQPARAVLDVLRSAPRSYLELARTGLVKPQELDRIVALLAMTRHLDLGGSREPLGVEPVTRHRDSLIAVREGMRRARSGETRPPQRISSLAPASVDDPETTKRRKELSELAESLPSLSYYEVLGVTVESDTRAIQGAFFQLAKLWHPDKLPPALRDQKDAATRIFARMTEAHRVLCNPSQREEYDALLERGGDGDDEQRKVRVVLGAATAFQKAEVLARKGDWAGAVELARQAMDGDSEQIEYRAFWAWVTAKSGRFKAAKDYNELVDALNSAVKQLPENLRVRLYRAEVFKLAGLTSKSIRDYRFVHDADPRNVDAAREIRLHKMRADGSSSSEGLLGRLFTKSKS